LIDAGGARPSDLLDKLPSPYEVSAVYLPQYHRCRRRHDDYDTACRILAELQRQVASVTVDRVGADLLPVTLADVARTLLELQVAQILAKDDDEGPALSA
jgi:hypothetical protein